MATEAQIRATTKYEHKSYDKITLRLKKGDREKISAYAAALGLSLNSFFIIAAKKEMGDVGKDVYDFLENAK